MYQKGGQHIAHLEGKAAKAIADFEESDRLVRRWQSHRVVWLARRLVRLCCRLTRCG
jgi:hypothetical protein